MFVQRVLVRVESDPTRIFREPAAPLVHVSDKGHRVVGARDSESRNRTEWPVTVENHSILVLLLVLSGRRGWRI